ncbi:MAG: hypothetical protein QOH93_1245 [Chloroflexia bacterium]|jgi:hypothetical protein|nr:hypothetical protein [Chloroflexia bacterium]
MSETQNNNTPPTPPDAKKAAKAGSKKAAQTGSYRVLHSRVGHRPQGTISNLKAEGLTDEQIARLVRLGAVEAVSAEGLEEEGEA